MRVRFGIWHSELAMFFREQLEGSYTLQLTRNPVTEKGQIILRREPDGSALVRHCENAEDTMDYPWRLLSSRREDGFVRSALMTVDLRTPIPGSVWYGDLPFDDEFSWPKARDCEQYFKDEELLAEAIKRRDYAARRGRVVTPPAYVTQMMTPQMRKALFNVSPSKTDPRR